VALHYIPEDGREGRNMEERLNNKRICYPCMCTLLFTLFVKHVLIRAPLVVADDDASVTFDRHVSGERLCGVEKLFVTPVN
jgi:hypothetical protein